MTWEEPSPKRFVVDSMLGKVSKWLRILGFSAHYHRLSDERQVEDYIRQGFLIVSRNQRWCGRARVFCPRSNDPMEQLQELVAKVPITLEEIRLLTICVLCNEPLRPVSREEALDAVPDYVFETNTSFVQCPKCQKLYWPGSHPKRMMDRLRGTLGWPL